MRVARHISFIRMKKIILLVLTAVMLASCAVHKHTSTVRVMNQKSFYEAPLIAELEVGEKIVYAYYPTKQERKNLSLQAMKENAVAAALEANDKADVLLHPQYKMILKGILKNKCERIIVTGFPAHYKAFREPGMEELEKIILLNNGQAVVAKKKKEVVK